MKNFFKSLPLIILLSLVAACVSVNVFAEDTTSQLGDIDADGQITAADALLVLKHAAKISTVEISLADINKSDTVDATDALWILKYAARLISDFSDETINATPVPTATPIPVQDNIKKVKNHLKTNGINEDSIYYLGFYITGEESMVSYMVYYADEDLLQMEFSYYEETEEEATLINVYMPITGSNTESFYYAGYALGDYSKYIEASAPINISTITYDTTINYTQLDSYNINDEDLPSMYKDAADLTKDALRLWDDICKEETDLGLKDLGFSKL